MNGDDLSEHDKRELTVSLRAYFERLLMEHEKTHTQLAENVRVALTAQDKRLDGMNEFRKSLEDFQGRSVSRELFDQRSEQVNEKMQLFENFRSRAMGAGAILALLAGAVGAAIMRVFIK